jgi:branched-chain amino acid transport system permease protein
MSSVLSQIFHGLMLGVLYSLIASGYTLIFGVLNVVNFAHGDVCILGAFVLMTVVLILAPISITLGSWYFILFLILITIAVTGGLGVVIERLTVNPFDGPHATLSGLLQLPSLSEVINISILMVPAQNNFQSY